VSSWDDQNGTVVVTNFQETKGTTENGGIEVEVVTNWPTKGDKITAGYTMKSLKVLAKVMPFRTTMIMLNQTITTVRKSVVHVSVSSARFLAVLKCGSTSSMLDQNGGMFGEMGITSRF